MFRYDDYRNVVDYVKRRMTVDREDRQMINSITIGVVTDNDDPSQEGRLKVFCPAIDYNETTSDDLPWSSYATPFGGVVENMKVGVNEDIRKGAYAYGWWAIPKIGALVFVFHLNGDPTQRFWFACYYKPYLHKTLPGGMTILNNWVPLDEDGNEIEYKKKILEISGLKDDITRGFSERNVTDKEVINQTMKGDNGYANSMDTSPNKKERALDPQIYCFGTPGGHYITMTDMEDHCRVRLMTTMGKQILLDDTNERIFISTSSGNAYIEMDEDGHIHVYGSESISFSAGTDVNISANNNLNVNVGGDINTTAGNETITKAKKHYITGDILKNTKIPKLPNIVPQRALWIRPKSKYKRNKFWKP